MQSEARKSFNRTCNLLLIAACIGATALAIAAPIELGWPWWKVGFVFCSLLAVWAFVISWIGKIAEQHGLLK